MEGDKSVTTETPVKEEDTESVLQTFPAYKEDEEATLDGGFIEVEKEALAMKGGSNVAKLASVQDDESMIVERRLNNLGRELLEAQEKMKELEVELERVTGALKHSESENTRLKDEALLAKEKLDEAGKRYDELDLSHRKLQEHVVEAEKRYSLELTNLQEALQAQEGKRKELIEVKEAFDGLNIEIENSRKRMQELEQDVQSSVVEARKFEELHKQSGSLAESETQRALEFERLLETAKLSAKEMEDQMASLKEEIKGLYEKVAVERSAEREVDRANVSHQRSREQEDLFQTSHSKLEGAAKEVNEFELVLDLEKYRIQELEERISILDNF